MKIVDEADNLYGFNLQSGVDPIEFGMPVHASPQIIESLISTAESKGIFYEMRICHHLENYHGLYHLRRSMDRHAKLDWNRLHFED